MAGKDKLDLSNKNFLDAIIDYRRPLVFIVAVISVVLIGFIPSLETDPTVKSGIDRTSLAYQKYEEFIKLFGHEEFSLIAIKSNNGANDLRTLKSLGVISKNLEAYDKIAEVVSLSTIKIFQEKDGRFGTYPIVREINGRLSLPAPADLAKIKTALPVMDLMLSTDYKTVGILVRIHDEWKLNPSETKKIFEDVDRIVKDNLPPGADFRIIGPPLVRQAISRYNIQTAFIFGALCMIIGTLVSIYVFRSVKVTLVTNAILGLSVLWVLGFMALIGVPLNSTTMLSFGFIPITSLEMVIHMVVRYHQFHRETLDKIGALKKTVRWLARPCFICVATTAVGFGSLMVSSIPMVAQLGFIMGVGVLMCYFLALVLTPAFFSVMKAFDTPESSKMLQGWLDRVITSIEGAIFTRSRLFVMIGVLISVILLAGAPTIRSDTQVLRFLSAKTPEVKDITFVEHNLTSVSSAELLLEAPDGSFKKPEVWKRVAELDSRLKRIPEVAGTESFLPLLQYLHLQFSKSTEQPGDLFVKPDIIPQLLMVTSLGTEGKRLAQRYMDESFGILRISVRIKNSPTVPISKTIEQIEATAKEVMGKDVHTSVTGDLAVFASQASNLIDDQIKSMFLAAILITILMMIQMGSAVLGLICLVPNIPPVAAVFGIMGWFGISLDSVTVFAATVAVGLAVDNTIHYLTQLKREIYLNPDQGIENCVRTSYQLTAKQIASWTVVTLLGFLALAVSPFRPVVFFGILGCCSLMLGMFGDLVFIQSLILSSATIRNTIRKLIDRELAAEK